MTGFCILTAITERHTLTDIDRPYLFEVPTVEEHLSRGARVALYMGALASRLVEIDRTRCIHPDQRAENVAEHSLMLSKVAPELARVLYPELDENLVARFGGVHDDVEAYVGDTPTDIIAGHDRVTKEEIEALGLKQLAKEFAHIPSYVDIIRRYEAQEDPEARFVRAVDKLMVLLIHVPNNGATLRAHYTYETFLRSETDLLKRDEFKYGEFTEIMELRRELGQLLADRYLQEPATTSVE